MSMTRHALEGSDWHGLYVHDEERTQIDLQKPVESYDPQSLLSSLFACLEKYTADLNQNLPGCFVKLRTEPICCVARRRKNGEEAFVDEEVLASLVSDRAELVEWAEAACLGCWLQAVPHWLYRRIIVRVSILR